MFVVCCLCVQVVTLEVLVQPEACCGCCGVLCAEGQREPSPAIVRSGCFYVGQGEDIQSGGVEVSV